MYTLDNSVMKNMFPNIEKYEEARDIYKSINLFLEIDKKRCLICRDEIERITAYELILKAINEIYGLKRHKDAKKEDADNIIANLIFNTMQAICAYDEGTWNKYLSNIIGLNLTLEILKVIDAECLEELNYSSWHILKKLKRMDNEKYKKLIKKQENNISEIIALLKV